MLSASPNYSLPIPPYDWPNEYIITVEAINVCGVSSGAQYATLKVDFNGVGSINCRGQRSARPTVALYPNPARETVDVHVEHATPAAPVTVRLKTDQLPAGLYFVHLLRGTEVLSCQQLRIEK